MRFKNDKQRKAVMANLNSGKDYSHTNPQQQSHKPMLPSERRNQMMRERMNKDSDGDGVPDSKDCEPFNPKKQGFLHDLNIKILKKREERLETKRESALKKLEDTKDVLKEKSAIADKKSSIKETQLKQKQAVIDETNRERNRLDEIKQANIEAKRQLDKITISGKTKTALKTIGRSTGRGAVIVGKQAAADSKLVFQRTKAFLQKDSTKRSLKKIGKIIAGKK